MLLISYPAYMPMWAHCGFTVRQCGQGKPTANPKWAPCGLAHVGPTEVFPLGPLSGFTVGLPTENPHQPHMD